MTPGNLSPLYTGGLLVHGMGFSPDHRTLDVVSVGSNSVTFIDTATNAIKHVTYVGRSPHEAFYTPDGKLAHVCSSFTPETVVIDRASHRIVGHVRELSPFSPDIAAAPDGTQVWLTLKDIGKTQIFNARPPFETIATLDSGSITNHVNIVRNAKDRFAYVKAYTTAGLDPGKPYTLAIASNRDGSGAIEALAGFKTNPAGAAIVSTIATLRAVLSAQNTTPTRRYLVILEGIRAVRGAVVQTQR